MRMRFRALAWRWLRAARAGRRWPTTAPRTVSDYANAMNASAARLDAAVTERQQAGDMAAAQRLVLAAAMVRRAAEEFRGAEQEALTDPVSGLPAPLPERLAAALARQAEKAESRAADRSRLHRGGAGGSQRADGGAADASAGIPCSMALLSRDLADRRRCRAISSSTAFGSSIPSAGTQPVVTFDQQRSARRSVVDERPTST